MTAETPRHRLVHWLHLVNEDDPPLRRLAMLCAATRCDAEDSAAAYRDGHSDGIDIGLYEAAWVMWRACYLLAGNPADGLAAYEGEVDTVDEMTWQWAQVPDGIRPTCTDSPTLTLTADVTRAEQA